LIDLFIAFTATFSNISAISWRTVLVVEETGVPEDNHRPWASNW
jgi:predicted component of type VI protein secretion system